MVHYQYGERQMFYNNVQFWLHLVKFTLQNLRENANHECCVYGCCEAALRAQLKPD